MLENASQHIACDFDTSQRVAGPYGKGAPAFTLIPSQRTGEGHCDVTGRVRHPYFNIDRGLLYSFVHYINVIYL